VQQVAGPGLRFELCWDHQGSAAEGGADLDLHVHRARGATPWFRTTTEINPDDCYYFNCTGRSFATPGLDPLTGQLLALPGWYPASPLDHCRASKYGAAWETAGICNNPRLDVDNIDSIGVPENANIDAPAPGDTFRALVHYYGQDLHASTAAVVEHPIVNIYCGGRLKAVYGQGPDQLQGFDFGSGFAKGQMWRVADVTARLDGAGNIDCAIEALHPPGATTGYWVVSARNNIDLSY
jgi:hypothetical protein